MRVMLAPQYGPDTHPGYWDSLLFPMFVSPKLDGIRAYVQRPYVYSRSNKVIPNMYVQDFFGNLPPLDGELVVGDPTDNPYNRTQSMVMSYDKSDDLKFYVFDIVAEAFQNSPYFLRLEKLKEVGNEKVVIVPQTHVDNLDELLFLEEKFLDQGYEGIIMRNPGGPYKEGRATLKEGIIWKLKRFEPAEGRIVGLEEGMENTNPQIINELGLSSRASFAEGKIPSGMLGTFLVEFEGDIINVSASSFSHEERREFLKEPEKILGNFLQFKYFKYGIKNAPRQAVALRIRDVRDMI
jgi:DNA ligase-1